MTTRHENPESLTDSARFHEARGLADRLASTSVDVPEPARAREGRDDRTTAEWIADLVKARQTAESERDELRAEVDRLTRERDSLRSEVAHGRLDRAELADEAHQLRDRIGHLPDRLQRAEAEAERLRATVARVEAERAQFEATGERLHGVPAAQTWLLVSARLRAVLAGGVAADAPTSSDGGA